MSRRSKKKAGPENAAATHSGVPVRHPVKSREQ